MASVSDMIGELSGKRRWTIAEDYHPHIVSVSRYVHRNDIRFISFDSRRQSDVDYIRRNSILGHRLLPDLRKNKR